jgi:hypothetical protein
MGFRKVKHIGETDSNVKNLDYELEAINISIDIINNSITVKYDKVYKDINGVEFKREPMSYRVNDEAEIYAWDEAVGAMFETAIVSQMKSRNGIV